MQYHPLPYDMKTAISIAQGGENIVIFVELISPRAFKI